MTALWVLSVNRNGRVTITYIHVSNPLLSELTLMVREGLYLYIWQKAFLLSVSNLMYAICMMDSEETSKGTELTFKENNLF